MKSVPEVIFKQKQKLPVTNKWLYTIRPKLKVEKPTLPNFKSKLVDIILKT